MNWVNETVRHLQNTECSEGGWSYQTSGRPYHEPTALVALALYSNSPQDESILQLVRRAASLLGARQQADGALGLAEHLPQPQWPTAWAMLLWNALGSHPVQRRRAQQWLHERRGHTFTKVNDVLGHDTTIPGWPWVHDTHSWVEPTAAALLALRGSPATDHRVEQGLALLRDRAIPGGGWNVGNNVVRGRVLRPQCAPTGLALLALAAHGCPADSRIRDACRYLQTALPNTRAPASLCWGILALRAWRTVLQRADQLLQLSFQKVMDRGSTPPLLAYLLLASQRRTLQTLSIPCEEEVTS
jgi:hypothetical protein